MEIAVIKNRVSESFERYFRQPLERCVNLKGDGSDRKIFRMYGDTTVIGVYGENPAENEAFISFTRHFLSHNLPVPDVFDYDPINHVYLLEDLGDVTLCDWLRLEPEPYHIKSMYEKVLDYLPQFQKAGQTVDFSKCYQFDTFDAAAIKHDLDYFREAFLNRFVKKPYDVVKLQSDFDTLISHLIREKPDFFLYRDFQSRNIMIQKNMPRFIDYQSGRRGALQYDVASLLFDGNVDLSQDFRGELVDFYLQTASKSFQIDEKQFNKYFYEFALVRILQILAAFSYLSFVKNKKAFLSGLPQAIKNLKIMLHDTNVFEPLPELQRIFERDLFCNTELENFTKQRVDQCAP